MTRNPQIQRKTYLFLGIPVAAGYPDGHWGDTHAIYGDRF